jgi:spermidine/putrescine transport system substrate-binding protein
MKDDTEDAAWDSGLALQSQMRTTQGEADMTKKVPLAYGHSPARFSRRSFLVSGSSLLAASALLSGGRSLRAADMADEIRWYTWGTYYKPSYMEGFTESTGIELVIGSIESNDQEYAKMRAGGNREWDVFDVENVSAPLYIKEGLVQPLDFSRIPNSSMLFPNLRAPHWNTGADGQQYFIVHAFGIDTIAYRADLIDTPPTSWNDLFDPKHEGKIGLMDYALDVINLAGLALYGQDSGEGGYSAWTDGQLEEIKKKLSDQKRLVRTYWKTEADNRNLFLNGEITIGFSWVPTAYALQDEGLDVQLALPKEGPFAWSDNLAISSEADEETINAAYELINFILGPDYGIKINRDAPYTTGTTYGWLDQLSDEEQKILFLDQVEMFETFNYRALPPNYDKWVQMWEEVKAG